MPESKSGALPLGDSPVLLLDKIAQGMTIQPSRHETAHIGWELRQCRACCQLSGELGKNARPGACHSRHPRTIELFEPIQMARHLGIKAANHRLKIVMPMLD